MNTANLRLQLFRKVGKNFRPFLYDNIIDGCAYLEGFGHRRQTFWGLLYPMVKQFTNINHSCPFYPQDLVLRNLTISNDFINMIPLPKGIYRMQQTYFLNNAKRCIVNIEGEKP
uniref:Uncharacterized protein n=1 Tax=Stomoxys calcitrans TaxID=35570 RepID=A0A1I8Q5S2_STOCA